MVRTLQNHYRKNLTYSGTFLRTLHIPCQISIALLRLALEATLLNQSPMCWATKYILNDDESSHKSRLEQLHLLLLLYTYGNDLLNFQLHCKSFFHFNKKIVIPAAKIANTLYVQLTSGNFVVITKFSCRNKESLTITFH